MFIDGDAQSRVLAHKHLHTEVLLPKTQLQQQDPRRHGLVEVTGGALGVGGGHRGWGGGVVLLVH